MGKITVEAERVIDERPDIVYAFLRDYRVSHPQVLPSDTFHDFMVEEGGEGEGTIFRCRITSPGRSRNLRMRVSEPKPGSVLQENDLESSMVTRFIFTPVENGAKTNVKIWTEWDSAGGIGGFMERTFAPRFLKGVYLRELAILEATRGSATPPAGQ